MRLNVAVAIATSGRRDQLSLTLDQLANLDRLPDRILVCPASSSDYDGSYAPARGPAPEFVTGPRGVCAQRNAIISKCENADLIVFFDDDFYPAPDYIERAVELFASKPDVAVATSYPLRDGATGPGLTHSEALETLGRSHAITIEASTILQTYGGYGCNMVVRAEHLRRHAMRFDERLPLYGWLEDIELSRRLARHGRIISCSALRGVHLGTKVGRTSGRRLGYSQVANPIYMVRKGSMTIDYAMRHVVRNVAANAARFVTPEAWVDRRGRLRGNLRALADLATGRLDPGRILQL